MGRVRVDAGAGGRHSVQRFTLPFDQLRPGRHQRPAVPQHHGEPRQPVDVVRHSPSAAVVVCELGGIRAHVLPADRCTSLLLLVHRRVHRERVSSVVEGPAGALRSHDHRLQSGGHVCGRSHPARPQDVSRRLYRARRVHDSQGIRLVEDLGGNRQPDEPRARSHPGFRRGGRASSASSTTTSTCRLPRRTPTRSISRR